MPNILRVLERWPDLVRHPLTLDQFSIGFAIMILYFLMAISGLGQGVLIQRVIFSFATLLYSITPILQLSVTLKLKAPYNSLFNSYTSEISILGVKLGSFI